MRLLVNIGVFAILSLVAISSCSENYSDTQNDWIDISHHEIGNDSWRTKDINKYIFVEGDFNGDKIVDKAKLLVLKDNTKLGLFAYVSQENRTYKIYLLDETDDINLFHAMGIKKVTPGLYKTACGKGYWKCKEDELSEIAIQHDAIDYFKIESANSFFYWDVNENTFKRIWISD